MIQAPEVDMKLLPMNDLSRVGLTIEPNISVTWADQLNIIIIHQYKSTLLTARYLRGEHPEVFSFKLGCFAPQQCKCLPDKQPLIELKTNINRRLYRRNFLCTKISSSEYSILL